MSEPDTLPLVGLPDPIVIPSMEPGERISPGQKITIRQRARIDAGIHPLRGGSLHPEAPKDAAAGDRGRPFTCGGCEHRQISGWGFPKCVISSESHCQQSDVRAWWPACSSFFPRGGPEVREPAPWAV